MSQESQTLSSHGQSPSEPILDDIAEIYRSQPDATINYVFQAERVADPVIRKIYKDADEINQNRSHRLDSQFFDQTTKTHAERRNSFVSSATKVIFKIPMTLKRPEPLTEDILRAKESEVGATIFGEMAPNEVQREFFYEQRIADRDSWFFHQAVDTPTGLKDVTIHYEVHPKGVLRVSSHPDTKNAFIEGDELDNFKTATDLYRTFVLEQVYSDDSNQAKKLLNRYN